ncbi:MAG: hypothetical protein K1W05_05000, partial [Desulfovibrio sp.]
MKLTQGAYGFLCRRYRNILVKCGIAAICALALSAPALAAEGADDLPAPGSSFTVDRVMVFKNQDISYGTINGPNDSSDFALVLEDSKISAKEVNLTHLLVKATNSRLSSTDVITMAIHEGSLDNSEFYSSGNMTFNGPLNVLGGENLLKSGKDLGLRYGTVLTDGATLTLEAKEQIFSGNDLRANNIRADYINSSTSSSSLHLSDGIFVSENLLEEKYGPSMIGGFMRLENMKSRIGSIVVFGDTKVSGGNFDAKKAIFGGPASFSDSAVTVSSLSAADFAVDDGSLNLGADGEEKSNISGNLNLKKTTSNIGNLEVKGMTTVTGGSLTADTLTLGATVFDNIQPQIENLTLNGPLTLRNKAVLDTKGDVIGNNQVSINSESSLKIDGSFATEKLYMDQGTLSASGYVNVSMIDFELNSSKIIGDSITMQDMSSSGQSLLDARTGIKAGKVDVYSGRMVFQTSADAPSGAAAFRAGSEPGTIDIDALRLHGGAIASLKGGTNIVGSVQGTGSLDARNLQVTSDLSLNGGELHLSGSSKVGNNLWLEEVKASVGNFEVIGDANIKKSSVTGNTVTLDKGATLEDYSSLQVNFLKAGADITLSGNSEILAGDMDLGGGHLVLDGKPGEPVVAAVGEFGGGDLTVEANSLLSIGADSSDWANMIMGAHNASAALGLWTPFRLGEGSYAAVGAGSLARNNGSPRANQIVFSADSLLVTNAAVASKDGKGAISSVNSSLATVEAGAKLHILHAQKDGLYRVLGDNVDVDYKGDAWQGDNVKTDSVLIKLERLGGDKLGWFQAKTPGASTVLPGLDPDIGGSVDDAGNKNQIPPEPDSVPRPPANKPVTPQP